MKVKDIPRFPAIERDLSIVVDEEISWADIEAAVDEKGVNELEEIRFVGIYRGKGIEEGQKSVTISLRFRDEEGTLTHQQGDGFEAEILENLTKATGAVLRTA